MTKERNFPRQPAAPLPFRLDFAYRDVLTLERRSPMSARILVLLCCVARSVTASPSEDNVRSNARDLVISHIPRERVASSAIASIGYSKRRHILEVEFLNGAIYRYLEVPPSIYRELISAGSKARYYDANIKGHYSSVHVRPRVKKQSK